MTSVLDRDRAERPARPPWAAPPAVPAARWVRLMLGWCVGVGIATFPLLARGVLGMLAGLALWATLATALATWSSRQRLRWAGTPRSAALAPASWVAGYAAAVVLGATVWRGHGWAWLECAALSAAAPAAAGLVSAVRRRRHAGSR